ncbi:zinc finger BED domain-containing protein RICESLEEPER 2-like isoform X1 [Phragmites australis]|uniref:zinc finger BED domain-containing protein RICESLEEPER 2-like isoform X1 n=1 Tax=Phragmites australis TaxID=29695 RepID=UPI002D79AF68|nr:zinc finger BED domain-containing protein RICESLEEPER 2-like isoform X1 [Phragmites australis]XP_062206558.1 zinc finger BED domain-containing protein RICESLEEPER 2-like isoform X1 [Phragmites australis]
MAEAHPCRRPPLGPGSAASSTAPIACEPSMATLAQQDLPPSRSATRPSPPTTVLCSTSPTAAAPPPPSSAAVSPKIPGGNRAKASDAKRFSSPIIPMVVKSPGIRLMLSPRLRSPSPMSISSSRQKASNPSHGSSRKNRRRKLRSDIWIDFEPIYDSQTLVQAKCKHCNKLFKSTRDVGTSACRRHLKSCDGKTRLDRMLAQMNSNNDASLKDWKFDQEVSRLELVKLIVVHEMPFSLVEYPKFRSFVASLNPWFTLVSRTTIKADCVSTYGEGKVVLREILKKSTSRVSLTADLWTSNQTLGYLCVTCHYIDDDWRIHKRIIKFTLVETPHDGRTMFNAMLRSLQDWNIEDKVFALTLDNATVNDSFVRSLQENLVAKRLLVCKGELFHYRCAAHVFNLIAQEGLKAISGATYNIRESVKYVKSSQARKQRFEKMVEQVGIYEKRPPLDVATRWNSTYNMLLTSLLYKRAFEALSREDTQYIYEPSDEEWNMADKLCGLLKVFSDATKVVSGSKYPTVSCYFHHVWEVKKMLERESSNPDLVIATVVHEMRQKLKKYWDMSFLKICIPVVFDPRFKLKFLEFRLRQGFEGTTSSCLSIIEKTTRKLFDEYSLQMGDLVIENAQTNNNNELNVDESGPWADWSQHQSAQQIKRVSELDKYLEEETVPVGVDFDILQFWKMYSTKYPILARMARDLLAVPASTVASESAFSTGERVINDYRSRLSSDTIEALICLQDWIRENDTTSDNIAGNLMGDDDES